SRSRRLARRSRVYRQRDRARPARRLSPGQSIRCRTRSADRHPDPSPDPGRCDGDLSRAPCRADPEPRCSTLGRRRRVSAMTQGAEAISDTAPATRHVYPTVAMLGDYFRAAAGLVPVAAVFAIEPVGPVAATVLGGFGVVFGVFGLRTLLRHGMSVEMTD